VARRSSQRFNILKVATSRQQFQSGRAGFDQRLSQRLLRYQGMSRRRLAPQAARGIALRIEVYQQHSRSGKGQPYRHVDGGRRLSDAPFLVRNAQDSTHGESPLSAVWFIRIESGGIVAPEIPAANATWLTVPRETAGLDWSARFT